MVTNTHCLLPSGEFPYPAAHPHLPDPDGKQKIAKHTSLLSKTTSSLGSCLLPPSPVPSWSGQETSRCSEHRAPGVFSCGPRAWLWSFSEAKGSQMEEERNDPQGPPSPKSPKVKRASLFHFFLFLCVSLCTAVWWVRRLPLLLLCKFLYCLHHHL